VSLECTERILYIPQGDKIYEYLLLTILMAKQDEKYSRKWLIIVWNEDSGTMNWEALYEKIRSEYFSIRSVLC
jgi:hypothetical protein